MNTSAILDDVVNARLKSKEQLQAEEVSKENAKLTAELHWGQLLKTEAAVEIIKKLDEQIKLEHQGLLNIAEAGVVPDNQVRNFLVRYSTLCRTRDAIVNNTTIV